MPDRELYEEGLLMDLEKAKARIEVLIAERDEAWKRASHAEKMWALRSAKLLESEALLAKAAKAFDCWRYMMNNPAYDIGEMLSEFDAIVCTTIEELTK